jgi:hypothetical protein
VQNLDYSERTMAESAAIVGFDCHENARVRSLACDRLSKNAYIFFALAYILGIPARDLTAPFQPPN